MGMYSTFKTDNNLEKKGVVVDYGDFRVTVARAGGSNKKFQRVWEAKSKPHRFAMQNGTISTELSEKLMHECFAEACVLNWETATGEKNEFEEHIFEQGIEGPDGSIIPFTVDNVLMTFRNLPDIFHDIKEQCMSATLFRQAELDEDVKN